MARLEDRVARLEAAHAADRLRRAAAKDRLAHPAPPNPKTTQAFAELYRHFPIHQTPWFHGIWYAAMDDPDNRRLFIMGPRLHAKTSCVLTYTLRRLCEDHQLRVGIISQTDALAKHFLAEIKYELQANDALIRQYATKDSNSNPIPFQGDRWTEHQITLSDAHDGPRGISGKDVSIFSVGRGGQITGYHCDLLIVDDLETKEATDSDLVRQGTREWWSREVEPVLVPGGKLIGTGTRKHFDDIYSYWLRPGSGWNVVDAVKSVYTAEGQPIWPEMWSLAALKARKSQMDLQDLLAWPQEYLNQPRPAETQMFYPDAWPTFKKPPFGLTIFMYWDLAISGKTGADYTVGWTIGVDSENNVFLLERRRGHWDFNTTLAEIGSMGAAWPMVQAIGIEQVAYQAAAVQEALRRTMLPIVPDKISGGDKDKVTRAKLLEARAAAKKVVRPEDAPWWVEFAQEALYFPAGSHDDQTDALSGAVKLAGFQASSIAWQYGVWECIKCKHQFHWEKGRHCPKCNLQVPDTFENPEMVAYGGHMEARPENENSDAMGRAP